MKKIGFIGLGVMGFPMAGHLAAAGHELLVFNRSPAKTQLWLERHSGKAASTPGHAARDADLIFTCVGDDEDLRQAVFKTTDSALHHMKPGAILIDHSSTTVAVAQELDQLCRKQGMHFVDAPVSGGQAGAEQGQLTIMAGGNADIVEQIRPILANYSKQLQWMGEAGAGQKTKMVNQICVAGLLQGLAEAIHFAQQAELDVNKVLDVISQGAAQSWQMENRGRTMANSRYDFGFAVDWMRKDLTNCLAEARTNQSQLPVTALVDQFYGDLQRNYQAGRLDTSSLLIRLQSSSNKDDSN